MYNGFAPKQEVVSLESLDSDIELSLLAQSDLMIEEQEGLNLRRFRKINKDKVLKTIDRMWNRLDRDQSGKISKQRAKKCTERVLKALGKADAYNEATFNYFFDIADVTRDKELNKDELLRLTSKFLDSVNALGN